MARTASRTSLLALAVGWSSAAGDKQQWQGTGGGVLPAAGARRQAPAAEGEDARRLPTTFDLQVCKEVDLYKIPPRMGASGHRSGDWKVADKSVRTHRPLISLHCTALPSVGLATTLHLWEAASDSSTTHWDTQTKFQFLISTSLCLRCRRIFTARCKVVAIGEALEVRLEDPSRWERAAAGRPILFMAWNARSV